MFKIYSISCGVQCAKNVLQHEFIGLRCCVTKSCNQVQIGIEGKIVNETMKMLVLETAKGKKCIKKRGTVFKVWLGDGTVEIDGNAVVGRPEERIKTVIKKW